MNYDLTVFDSDGTLVDSLVAHVRWVNDINSLYNFGQRTIPEDDIGCARKMMRPRLRETIKSCGFPEEMTEELVRHYNDHFSTDERYMQHKFPGVDSMLKCLYKRKKEYPIISGIVSANTILNIKRGIGNINNFDKCIGREELDARGWSKADALKSIGKEHRDKHSRIYVGDTLKDFYAASEAGFDFFGVTYGWEIDSHLGMKHGFETTSSVSGLRRLLGMTEEDTPL